MNERVHSHGIELVVNRRKLSYHDRDEVVGRPLHLVYGDTVVRVAWGFQSWQLWDKEKLERKIRAAATIAMEKHDAAMIQNLQLRSTGELYNLGVEIGDTLVDERKTAIPALREA